MPSLPFDALGARTVTRIRTRFCDTDLMGIIHHASYLAYFEMGRVEWLRNRGVTYTTWASRGWHLPVVEAHLRYRAPSRFDDLLDVETVLGELRAASLRFDYRIHRDDPNGRIFIAEGSTRLACVDDSHSVKRFTDEMMRVLISPERSLESAPESAPVE